MSHMMADLQLSGEAESGYGVRISGFHCSTTEFQKRISELAVSSDKFWKHAAQAEVNGHILFVLVEHGQGSLPGRYPGPFRLATYRREPSRFFIDLQKFLSSLHATFIEDVVLSESYGAMTMTLVYVPAPETSESSGG